MGLQLTVLRHGRPDKSLPDHRLHPLSPEGRQQAQKRRLKLGEPVFDLVVHSPLIRTRETALEVADSENGNVLTVTLNELFYSETDRRAETMDRAFTKFGHASLHEYYREAALVMTSFGCDAGQALRCVIENSGATNVLVVGHGMLLNSLCIALTGVPEPFMTRVLGECEGYRITLEDGRVPQVEILD